VAVAASTEANTDNRAAYGHNGNLFDKWTANGTTGWLRLQYASAVALEHYYIVSSPAQPTLAPQAWTVEGSNDGTSWTTLDTRSGAPAWAAGQEVRSYSFTNSTEYLYYRLNVSQNR